MLAIDENDELSPAQKAAAKRKLEDENKSWLQKNWMMLIPAGLIVSGDRVVNHGCVGGI